jgi:hypothetical protein
MSSRELEKVGKEPFKRSLFLPKYQQIIENLYDKAREQNEQPNIEIQDIPTIEDLNRLDLSKYIYEEEEGP